MCVCVFVRHVTFEELTAELCLTGTKLLQTLPSLSRPQPNVAIQFPVNFTNFQCNLDDVSLCALCRNFWFFTRSDALASDTLYTSLGNAFCFVFTLSSSLPASHLYWILLTLFPCYMLLMWYYLNKDRKII